MWLLREVGGGGYYGGLSKKVDNINYQAYRGTSYWDSSKVKNGNKTDSSVSGNGSMKITLTHTHSYTSVTTPATCTAKGKIEKTCTCGNEVTEEIPALGHDYSGSYVYETHNGVINGIRYKNCKRTGCGVRLETAYRNVINVRYKQADGTWGAWQKKVDKYVNAGVKEAISWSVEETNDHLGASASWTTTDNAKEVNLSIDRKENTLTVNPNEGTWEGKKTVQSFQMKPNDKRPIEVPVREGYTFKWEFTGKETGSTMSSLTAESEFKMGTGNATLKAIWTPITYEVAYHGNGNTNTNITMPNSTHTYGVEKNLTANKYERKYTVTYNYQYSGKANSIKTVESNFNGWAKNANSAPGAIDYTDSKPVRNLRTTSGVVDLYANWTKASITLETPTRTGYIFGGWSTTANSKTKSYNGGDTITPESNINLYAIWTPITYEVAYHGNGSTSGTMANSKHVYGVEKNLTANAYKREYKVTYNYKYSGQTNTTATATAIFNYWAKTPTGPRAYGNSEPVSNLRTTSGVVNLYANWTLANVKLEKPKRKGFTFKGWSTDSNAHTVDYNGGETITPKENITLYAVWEPYTAQVTFTKTDSITGEVLNGATFGLYEWDGSKYVKKSTLTDNGNGTYTTALMTYTDTNLGKFKIVEEKAPTYYTNGRIEKELILAKEGYNEYSYDIINEPNQIKVQAIKVDSETENRISGVTFTIYEWNKEKGAYEVYTRDESLDFQTDRSYLSEWLYANRKNEGKFRIVETGTPNGYYGDYSNGNKKTNDITIAESNNGKTILIQNKEGKYNNTRVTGTINVSKIDKETNRYLSQGEGTLDGAMYGLYAAEDINHKDTVTGKIYSRDELVKSARTTNGRLTFENVEIGKYYIKEIEAPKGYIKDETKYEVNMNYEGETVSHLTRNITIKEQAIKQAFNIKKVSSNSSTTELKPLANAGFKIFLIKDLEGVKNGTIKPNSNGIYDYNSFIGYDFSGEQTAIDYSKNQNGERIPELFSDANGDLTSPELAYGKYVVIESTVPENMKEIDPFIVTIERDSRTPQNQRVVVDEEFEAKIKVIKKDKQTGKTVLNKNAKYRIWNITENKYVEYTVSYPTVVKYGTEENPYMTNEKGEFITPLKLQIGEYELREIGAPEGYILTGHEGKMKEGTYTEEPKNVVKFSVKANTAYYEDPETKEIIINVEQYNDQMLGELEIIKTGEYLIGTQFVPDGKIEPVYEESEIQGAEFEIYAKEDIYTQDNQGTKLCGKDELVKKITTNVGGKAYIDNLPIGKYYIKEVKAGEGFTLNKEQKEFEIKYQGQETAVQKVEISYKNERQKIDLNGEEDPEKEQEELDPNKDLIILKRAAKDEYQIGETIQYIIKVINNGEQDIEKIVIEEHMLNGKFINLEENNKNGIEIANEGQKVAINKIEPGETITLRYEYIITEDTKVNIEEGGKVILGNKVTAKGIITEPDPEDPEKTIEKEIEDESTEETEITKEDNKHLGIVKQDLETGEVLQGAVIGLYAQEDIKGKDETILIPKDTLIEKVTTNEQGKAQYTVDLPLGKYYIKEIEAPTGYKLSEETIEIDGSYQGQDIEKISVSKILLNRSTKVKIEKKDKEGNLLEGAKLEIVTEAGKIVDSWETNEKVHITTKLEPGKTYILKEREPAKGYVTADQIKFKIDEEDKVYYYEEQKEEGITLKEYKEVESLEMIDEKTKVKIEIVDKETEEPIEGITVQIVDPKTGEVIYEYETDEEPTTIEGLPIGDYEIITKDEENRGYVTTKKDLIVEDTKEEQNAKIEQDYTKIEITLRDEETKELIDGKIQIIDKDGKIIQELETKDGKIEIEKLPIGEYTIHQTEATEGYFESLDKKIEIQDTREAQEFEILNKKKNVNFGVEKTLTSINLNGQIVEISDPKLSKLEIKTSEVKNTNLIAEYNIKITNKGEVKGKVKVLEKIPDGFEVVEGLEDWTTRIDGTLETEVELEAGQSKDLKISLKWLNAENNLGTKSNKALLENEEEDNNAEDDISEATIVISIKTGEIVSVIIIIMIIIALIICGYITYSVIKKDKPYTKGIKFLNK